jgi:hypothetical protein
MTAKCDRCEETDTQIASGTASHTFIHFSSDGNAACTTDGTETAKCEYCEATFTRVEEGTKGHIYFNGSCKRCGTEEPTDASLTGSVTSFGNADAVVTLSLFRTGEDTPAYTQTASVGTYSFDAVASGDYTLTVTKENHISRTYTLTVVSGENVLNVKICLRGDANGDGRINIGDVSKVYSHVKNTMLLIDDYALQCADVTENGALNIGDAGQIYGHVKGTKPLW